MATRKTPSAGGKPDKLWRDAIMRAVKRPPDQTLPKSAPKLEYLADKIVAKGLEGDVSAMREVGDRLDGKAPQAITSPEGGALAVFVIENGPKA